MKLKNLCLILLFFCVIIIFSSTSFAQQQRIVTFFPSPAGSFRDLRANRMVIHPTRAMPTSDGQLFWGQYSRRGILVSDGTGASIELGGTGSPYIDFNNDNVAATNFEARLELLNDNWFRIYTEQFEFRQKDNSGFSDIWLKCFRYDSVAINPVAPHTGFICEETLAVIP